jgi:hypothetical protein
MRTDEASQVNYAIFVCLIVQVHVYCEKFEIGGQLAIPLSVVFSQRVSVSQSSHPG